MCSSSARGCLVFCLLPVLLVLTAAGSTSAQATIEIRLDSVLALEGQTARMPLYLANYEDTLGGIQMYFQVDRPGICSLTTTIDTAGTLLSGWPWVKLNHLATTGLDLKVQALSSVAGVGAVPPLAPQAGTVPLLYLNVRVFTGLDTLFDTEAHINVITSNYTLFGFSTPQGVLVGYTPQETVDTNYYRCLNWLEDQCLEWQQVSQPPFDSMEIVVDTQLVLDTTLVKVLQRGYVRVNPWICGDFNGDRAVNLTDVTQLVNYMFLNGGPPARLASIDVASPCEFQISLTDLTRIVNYLFVNGSPLTCCPYE